MRRLRFALHVMVSLLSLGAALWGFWPVAREQRTQLLPRPILGTDRRLVLDTPERIKLGDTETMRLRLELAPLTGPVNAAPGVAEPGLLSDAPLRVVVEARLDAPGLQVLPSDLTSEPLLGGESVTFYWTVRGRRVGRHSGTLWVHLRDASAALSAESREPLSAQSIELPVVGLFGLSAALARAVGTIGLVLTGVLSVPFLLNARHRPPEVIGRE